MDAASSGRSPFLWFAQSGAMAPRRVGEGLCAAVLIGLSMLFCSACAEDVKQVNLQRHHFGLSSKGKAVAIGAFDITSSLRIFGQEDSEEAFDDITSAAVMNDGERLFVLREGGRFVDTEGEGALAGNGNVEAYEQIAFNESRRAVSLGRGGEGDLLLVGEGLQR